MACWPRNHKTNPAVPLAALLSALPRRSHGSPSSTCTCPALCGAAALSRPPSLAALTLPPRALACSFFALFWGLVARHLESLLKGWKLPVLNAIPYTAAVLIFGWLLGLWWSYTGTPSFLLGGNQQPDHGSLGTLYPSTEGWVTINGELVLYAFLPALVMSDAMSTNVHVFKKSIIQILLLATVSVGLGALLTGLVARYVFPYDWNWYISMILGSILAATDPVAVVALLKGLGAPRPLTVVITGESLLNDGTAAVMFRLFLNLETGTSYDAGGVIGFFARSALGGPAIGLGFGLVAAIWIGFTGLDAILKAGITVATAYLGFFVSEYNAEASGVLTVVTAGIVISAGAATVLMVGDKGEFVSSVWEFIEYVANTVIFFLAGSIVASRIFCGTSGDCLIQGQDWGWAFLLYVLVYVIRIVSIGLLMPILSRSGYGLTWRDMLVMSHGGLRGAVGLALAITYEETMNTRANLTGNEEDRINGARVVFFVAFIVIATLIVNGPSTPWVAKTLGVVKDPSAATFALRQEAREYISYKVTRDFERVKHGVLDGILGGGVSREVVAKYVSLNPEREPLAARPIFGRLDTRDSFALAAEGLGIGAGEGDKEDGGSAAAAGSRAAGPSSLGRSARMESHASFSSYPSAVLEDAEGEARAAMELDEMADGPAFSLPPSPPPSPPLTPIVTNSRSPSMSPPSGVESPPMSPSSPNSPMQTMSHASSKHLSAKVLELAAQENAEREAAAAGRMRRSPSADDLANEAANARTLRTLGDVARLASGQPDESLQGATGFAKGFARREKEAKAMGQAETGGAVLEMLRRSATIHFEEAAEFAEEMSMEQRREDLERKVRSSVAKELRTRFFTGMQRAYWEQLNEGYLMHRPATILIEVTDEALEQVDSDNFSDWDLLKRHCPEPQHVQRWWHRMWLSLNYVSGQLVGFTFSNDVVNGAALAVAYILAHREAAAYLRRVLGAGIHRIREKRETSERDLQRRRRDAEGQPPSPPEVYYPSSLYPRTQSEMDLKSLAGHSCVAHHADIDFAGESPPRAAVTSFSKAADRAAAAAGNTAAAVQRDLEADRKAATTGVARLGEIASDATHSAATAVPGLNGRFNSGAAGEAGGVSRRRTTTHDVVLPDEEVEAHQAEEIVICHAIVKEELKRLHEMSEVNEAHALAYLQRIAKTRAGVLENLRLAQVINLMLTREGHIFEAMLKEGVVTEAETETYLEELYDKRVRANRRLLGLGAVVNVDRRSHRSDHALDLYDNKDGFNGDANGDGELPESPPWWRFWGRGSRAPPKAAPYEEARRWWWNCWECWRTGTKSD